MLNEISQKWHFQSCLWTNHHVTLPAETVSGAWGLVPNSVIFNENHAWQNHPKFASTNWKGGGVCSWKLGFSCQAVPNSNCPDLDKNFPRAAWTSFLHFEIGKQVLCNRVKGKGWNPLTLSRETPRRGQSATGQETFTVSEESFNGQTRHSHLGQTLTKCGKYIKSWNFQNLLTDFDSSRVEVFDGVGNSEHPVSHPLSPVYDFLTFLSEFPEQFLGMLNQGPQLKKHSNQSIVGHHIQIKLVLLSHLLPA